MRKAFCGRMRKSRLSERDKIKLRICLKQHGVFAYPTESVYGLGCSPYNKVAVARLLALKQRHWRKGLILVASDMEQFTSCLKHLDAEHKARLHATWPGPVTWLVPATADIPAWITGAFNTVALRVSAHPLVSDLCKNFGPVVSTSANPAGLPPARSELTVRKYFPAGLDYIVSGETGSLPGPTPIIDLITNRSVRSL